MDYALQNSRINLGTLSTFGSGLSAGVYIKFDIKTTTLGQSTLFGSASTDPTVLRVTINPINGSAQQIGFKMAGSSGNLQGYFTNTSFFDGNTHTVEIIANPTNNTIQALVDNITQTITYQAQTSPTGFQNFATRLIIGGQDNGFGALTLTYNMTIDNFKLGYAADNLIAHYLFNEGTGGAATVLNDETVNGNDASLISGTWVDGLTYSVPSLTTSAPTDLYAYHARFQGEITSNGGGAIAQRGFVWSTSPNPTLSDNSVIVSGVTVGTFNKLTVDLIPETTYYYRAYALNGAGYGYSSDRSFTTEEAPSPMDLFGINVAQEFQDGFGWSNTNKGFPTYIDAYTLTPETKNQFLNDIRYLKGLGIKNYRFAAGDYTFTQRTTYHLELLEAMAALGEIHIEWGSLPYNTPSHFSTWRQSYLGPAVQAFQTIINNNAANGVTGAFILGNENEFQPGSSDITSVTRASNVVTVVLPFKHFYSAGWKVRITNSSILATGNYTIATIIDDYSFTINSSGSNGSQNSGKITYDDGAILPTQRNLFKEAATYCKSLSNPAITMPLAYSCIQGAASGYQNHPYYWADEQEGRGDVDYPDLNIYGANPISSNKETNWLAFKAQVDQVYQNLGSKRSRITEWNTSYNDDNPASLNNNLEARDEIFLRKKKYLENRGFIHYFFGYRMPSYLGEKHPPYNNNGGGIRPSFFKLIGKRSPYVEYLPL